VREDYAAQWAITQTELMKKLLYVIPRELKSRIRHHGPLDQRINKQPKLISNDHTIKQRLCCLEQGIINTDQALYLIYHREITYPIKVKRIVSAYTAQIHSGNKIGKELLIEENIKLLKRYYQTYLQHRSIQENTCYISFVGVKDPVTEVFPERLLSSTR
jgi:hypothetical protein